MVVVDIFFFCFLFFIAHCPALGHSSLMTVYESLCPYLTAVRPTNRNRKHHRTDAARPPSQIWGLYLSSLCHAKQIRPSIFPHPLSFLNKSNLQCLIQYLHSFQAFSFSSACFLSDLYPYLNKEGVVCFTAKTADDSRAYLVIKTRYSCLIRVYSAVTSP